MKDGNAGGWIYGYLDGYRKGKKLPSAAIASIGAGTFGFAYFANPADAVFAGKGSKVFVWRDFPSEASKRDAWAFNKTMEITQGNIKTQWK